MSYRTPFVTVMMAWLVFLTACGESECPETKGLIFATGSASAVRPLSAAADPHLGDFAPGACAGPFRLTAVNLSGERHETFGTCIYEQSVYRATSELAIHLSATEGTLYSDAQCSQAVHEMKIGAGQDTTQFYFKLASPSADPLTVSLSAEADGFTQGYFPNRGRATLTVTTSSN